MITSDERRIRSERRARDCGPPRGCDDRRCRAERRLPELQEFEISDSDWDRLFGGAFRSAHADNVMRATTVDIFDAARDGHEGHSPAPAMLG